MERGGENIKTWLQEENKRGADGVVARVTQLPLRSDEEEIDGSASLRAFLKRRVTALKDAIRMLRGIAARTALLAHGDDTMSRVLTAAPQEVSVSKSHFYGETTL